MTEQTTTEGTEGTEATATDAETTLVTAETTETVEDTSGETTEDTSEETTEDTSDETTDEEGDDAEDGAPEAYEDFVLPDGIELDAEITDEFKAVAKELNLSQDKAQKVIDLAVKMRERDAQAIVDTREEWIAETTADPEIGGDKLEQNLAVAKRAVQAYGSPEFIDLLNQTGLGNHPQVVRFMVNAGKAVSETGVVRGGIEGATPDQSLASRIYSSAKNKE